MAEALSGAPNLSEMTCGPDVVAQKSPSILTSGPCWFALTAACDGVIDFPCLNLLCLCFLVLVICEHMGGQGNPEAMREGAR